MKRVLALLLLLIAAACESDPGTLVAIVEGQRFDPASLTIGVGGTVTWVFEAGDAHTVTADEDRLPAGAAFFTTGGAASEGEARRELGDALLTQGATFEHTFTEPGRYEYFCIPHESLGMKGVIIVE